MRRKEICQKTGLTPKALRLYEEKGLISPKTESAGHNKTREYSQEDLELLLTISTLRRAMFTITEIKEMLEHPESIQDIYPQYLQWLRQQRNQLDALLAVSSAVDIAEVGNAMELTRQLRSAADALPLPAADIHFNFRKLDALEEPRPSFTAEQRLDTRLPDRAYRQSVVAVSKASWDNLLAKNDFLNDTRNVLAPESAAVGDPLPNDLRSWQKALRGGLTIAAFLTGILAFLRAGPPAVILFCVFLSARLLLVFFDHWKRQKNWVRSMGWSAEGFVLRKKPILLGVICGILGIGLVFGGAYAASEHLRPVEPTGGPSTEDIDLEEFWVDLDYQIIGPTYRYTERFDAKAITASPCRIYFAFFGSLYSINADYTELRTIDNQMYIGNGARSIVEKPEEQPCTMIYQNGSIYYLSWMQGSDQKQLMQQRSGQKIRPEVLATGYFEAVGLSENGEIICYNRPNSKWTEVLRVPVP
ncbi:MAG: MerR family transcriptional regulator [Oscillospiraceae bacterium]|nr:MerR family transcriptional regulator [Oscillospiraceae bacterium]